MIILVNNRFTQKIPFVILALVIVQWACSFPKNVDQLNSVNTNSINQLTANSPVPSLSVKSATNSMPQGSASNLLQEQDFEYLGAFRLPGEEDRPRTFDYGGAAMTCNPSGDPSGGLDGFGGSLFISGHDRLPSGELPDGNQMAEISIPHPVISKNLEALPTAAFIQPFTNMAAGRFAGLDEIPRLAMLYLETPATGPKIHLAWGQHLQPDPPVASHAWFNPDLSNPAFQGSWFIKDQSPYSVNGYMLEIPSSWAADYIQGRVIGAGRYRDGGWSGFGPSLVAYRPWLDEKGTPPADGAYLESVTLLQYAKSTETNTIERNMKGYQHPDEWEGAAWITTSSRKTGLLFAGTKAAGEKYWYGFVNPSAPTSPCVAGEFVGEMTVCRLADGSPCPESDLKECQDHTSYRGWWSTRFNAGFTLYNPDDLAKVAAGQMDPWAPQPYASINIDQYLFLNPAGIEKDMLGDGLQRRYRLGEIAYDRKANLLYVLELFADGPRPVVHVWKVK